MVFVFDEIRGTGETFPGFAERKQALNDALLEIAHAAGDTAHKSGTVDYVVRLTTSRWTDREVPAPNAFLLVDNVDNLLVFQKQGGGALQLRLRLGAEEEWFDHACAAFSEFRTDLGFSSQAA